MEYLEEVFSNNDCDLARMDQLIMHMDELRVKYEMFMEILVAKIPDPLNITWYQPSYQQHSSLRQMSKKVPEICESYRKDKFTKDEYERMDKNWKKLVKKFEIPNEPTSLARYTKCLRTKGFDAVRLFVYSYLARGLERTVFQVFNNFNSKYAYTTKGPYTPLEEKAIELCIEYYPHRNAQVIQLLSTVLNRHPRQIYNRIQYLQYGKVEAVKPQKWNLERANLFMKLLLKYSKLDLEQLRNHTIKEKVWKKMAKKMENKAINLKRFWYSKLHVQLFLQEDLKFSTLRRKLFKKLKKSDYKVWSDIKWNDFVKRFPEGFTSEFLYYLAIRSFSRYRQGLRIPLQEASDYALQHQVKSNKRIKRLRLTDEGTLEFIKCDNN